MGPVRQNPIQRTVSSVHVCAVHYVQLLHTILHRTDLLIFPLALQTITTAPMMSIWGKGVFSLQDAIWHTYFHIIFCTIGYTILSFTGQRLAGNIFLCQLIIWSVVVAVLGCIIQIRYLDGQALFCVHFMYHLLSLLLVDSMVQPHIPMAS